MSNYIVEAFKAMNLLESEDIALNANGAEELEGFLSEAGVDPDDEMIDVYDLETEAQDELKQSYIGKVVLECSVCHSDIFVDKTEISADVDEDGLACKDIECPYCMSNEGYTIIGEVAPYNEEESEALINPEDELEDEEELPEVDVEGAVDDVDEEDLEESLNECGGTPVDGKPIEEELKGDGVEELYSNDEIRGVEGLEGVDELEGVKELHGDKHEAPINEDIEDVTVTTEDETMTMTTKEDGGVVIETSPKEAELEDMDMEDMPIEDSDEEMIVPITDETSEVIDVATDALDTDDEEDFEALKDEMEEAEDESAEEEIGEEDFEDFDEESFNGLGESYLRNCYENVKSFKTTGVSSKNNKLFIEGVIKFDSGNIKETQFVFESLGNGKFEGYNKQISRGKKTYKLSGSVKNKKLVCESLNYNYRSKNELNESVRVYGTVKRK